MTKKEDVPWFTSEIERLRLELVRRSEYLEQNDREVTRLREELEFYHSLTVTREEGVTAIDGGETAKKLHVLWEAHVQNIMLRKVLSKLHTQVKTVGPSVEYVENPLYREVEEALTTVQEEKGDRQ